MHPSCLHSPRLVLIAALALAACASPVSRADRAGFLTQLDAGDYRAAADTAIGAGHITPDGQTQNLVWSLNAGSTLFDCGSMKQSVAVLDTTEKLAQADNLNRMHAAFDYRYTTYDGVMTNTYKALAFLAQGDRDDARVELRRAEDRQRRAEEYFQRDIAASAASHPVAGAPQFASMFAEAEQNPEYQAAAAHLGALAAYAPFQNPFATYLAGIIAASEGDFNQATDRLGRAAVMLGPQSPAAADLVWLRHAQHAGSARLPPQIWVVFENGQSATFHELRLMLPMVTGQPMTLALPVLAQNAPAALFITAQAGGSTAQTLPAGSFDAVMASEFHRRQPVILAEAVAEVLVKNTGSLLAAKNGNPFLKLASQVAANVSSADTRSWTALPKEFQAVRLPAPVDGRVAITDPSGRALGSVTVANDASSIVFVKLQSAAAQPAMLVVRL